MALFGRRSADAGAENRREEYERELDSGIASFFHPKADSCPWCGSSGIWPRIRVADTRQCKRGSFQMYKCSSCGHVFQNPQLTEIGRAYYYRDVYDGLGRAHYASIAEYATSAHRKRARLLADHQPLRGLLDVGARQGHFCREARKLLPGTRFWALDPSAEILAAADRGWVDVAACRPLIEFAEEHCAEFDAVSAIHYLERTDSPQHEVDAIRKVLRPGGVALIELVNLHSPFAKLHGRFWYCWMAPQNLHLMPWQNMCRLLDERRFRVIRVEFGAANKSFDNMAALLTMLNYYLPPAKSWPWLRRRVGIIDWLIRKCALALAVPVLALALVIDIVSKLVTTRGRNSNAYRIVAVAC